MSTMARTKRRLPGVPHAQLSLADEVARFETNALPDEVLRYLRAVDEYRAAGYPPVWRPEHDERKADNAQH